MESLQIAAYYEGIVLYDYGPKLWSQITVPNYGPNLPPPPIFHIRITIQKSSNYQLPPTIATTTNSHHFRYRHPRPKSFSPEISAKLSLTGQGPQRVLNATGHDPNRPGSSTNRGSQYPTVSERRLWPCQLLKLSRHPSRLVKGTNAVVGPFPHLLARATLPTWTWTWTWREAKCRNRP